ncbi:beta-amyrin 16-alpha-hydroxylase CYP87D16-like [Humulus lupulus]|uniref:beta-amyrin 16-alpha-hydroxylase CYP87D16-like n=1 Tax=Humulus lupulus TaxID=3486 RepID=UPI002B412518|nr:beta-amyrin 16-alpha-hydroxylase CYP87D16-like [Humulus lupulus]
MWINTAAFGLVGLLVIYVGHWIRRWRNPKCNGILPPGSMGFPLIGETLPLIIPSYSLDLHPFIKTRIQRYGTIFRTSIAGRPVIMSADPELNNFLLLQEGKLVELWYMDTFSKIFAQEGESRTSAVGAVHKYGRSIFLNHFGASSLKEKLLPQIEQVVYKTLSSCSTQDSVDIKRVASAMVLEFSAKQILSYDAETSPINITDAYSRIINGFMSFPVNIPGTAYHQCLKNQNKVVSMLKDMLKERQNSTELNHGDFLDQICKDMEKEKFLSEDFISQLIFGGLFATFESISAVIALAFSLLPHHPLVLEEMMAEHEAILKNRPNPNSSLTWDEYKSMPFTLHVINEILRLGNVTPGLLRKAIKDIPVKGFTIPAGWTIMLVTSAQQLSPNTFHNPLEFNPWRWKELDSEVVSKNFMPFGGGMRQCAGAEYSRVFMATFFHVLLTKYRWTKIKEGTISRNPILGFGKGIHIKLSKK